MRSSLGGILIPGILALVGLVVLVLWTSVGPRHELQARVPGLEQSAATGPVKPPKPAIPGKPTWLGDRPSPIAPTQIAGAWPWFRGQNHDAICRDDTVTLARQWPSGGPKVLWSIPLGEGYAGAAVRDGRVYVLDYDHKAQADSMRCFSLEDGQEIWRNSYPVVVKRYHGMSRTIPAVVGDCVISLGPKCHVTCWDAATGEARWWLDLVDRYGTAVPDWYAGQCPLVDGDRLILAPGGTALLVALSAQTGQQVQVGAKQWRTPNPHAWVMTHSSIMPMEFAGKRMYVYCGKGGVVGVSADDGSILWETTDWKIDIATCPSPLVLPGGRILLSGGYNAGALMLQLEEDAGHLAARTLARLKPSVFGSTHQTPVFYDGYVYGVREKDKQLVCLDLGGRQVWASGNRNKFGLGPYMVANGLIYVLSDTGLLTLAEATPKRYRQLAQAQVLQGSDAWGPMAMVAGRLILRDLTRMVCLDVTAH